MLNTLDQFQSWGHGGGPRVHPACAAAENNLLRRMGDWRPPGWSAVPLARGSPVDHFPDRARCSFSHLAACALGEPTPVSTSNEPARAGATGKAAAK